MTVEALHLPQRQYGTAVLARPDYLCQSSRPSHAQVMRQAALLTRRFRRYQSNLHRASWWIRPSGTDSPWRQSGNQVTRNSSKSSGGKVHSRLLERQSSQQIRRRPANDKGTLSKLLHRSFALRSPVTSCHMVAVLLKRTRLIPRASPMSCSVRIPHQLASTSYHFSP